MGGMKITAVETVRLGEHPNSLFVRVHTDAGLVGLGDTWRLTETVNSYVHQVAAPLLLGQDALAIERHWRTLYRGTAASGLHGSEVRGLSAIDVALWDLFGQAQGLPIYRLLGGPTRERVRVYNTCAGYRYGGAKPRGVDATYTDGASEGPYEDLDAWKTDAGRLAEDLLEQGITAMKIWPFDQFGPETGGLWITAAQIERGLIPFRQIREAVGNRMEIALEMHSVWNLPSAIRIAKAVEPYDPMWYEDPIRMDNLDALAEFKAATRVPTTASETLATRYAFRELLEKRAVSIVMFDVGWVGGLTEAKKIAAMAEAHHLPAAPHDCTGPVTYVADVHLDFAITNCYVQETVRAYLHGWYARLVTDLPRLERGYVYPPEGPGLGTALRPEVLTRPDAVVQRTEA
jgi:L-alanine-DL-glutamate epimerase-like enolase superfamily enzyme